MKVTLGIRYNLSTWVVFFPKCPSCRKAGKRGKNKRRERKGKKYPALNLNNSES